MYQITMGLAVFSVFLISYIQFKRRNLPTILLLDSAIPIVIIGFLGARL
jgi:prolipoprotein diacylglyceryltransferase